jgi:hypothetical protein
MEDAGEEGDGEPALASGLGGTGALTVRGFTPRPGQTRKTLGETHMTRVAAILHPPPQYSGARLETGTPERAPCNSYSSTTGRPCDTGYFISSRLTDVTEYPETLKPP